LLVLSFIDTVESETITLAVMVNNVSHPGHLGALTSNTFSWKVPLGNRSMTNLPALASFSITTALLFHTEYLYFPDPLSNAMLTDPFANSLMASVLMES